jgi:hypothetical protein
VHEFAHTIAKIIHLEIFYDAIIATNNLNPSAPGFGDDEYWAYSVQAWFSQSKASSRTRKELLQIAPTMYNYINTLFINDDKYLVYCSDFSLPMQ